MEPTREQESGGESTTRLVGLIHSCLRVGDYARALDLVRGAAAEFPNDAELAELGKSAEDGIKRKAEADRLITGSQELFAQQKPVEAIQLLRQAYELDRNNSLARTILANALVEHASSIVETDWLEADRLAKQALELNPAHPTAKTIRRRVTDKKKEGSPEEWATQARKAQSAGDLSAATSCIAQGVEAYPEDAKLLQIQDEVQRDQGARRRQARRRDLDELRRMERMIDGAKEPASRQALAERIQTVAAGHWTDGEIIAIANGMMHRLGLAPQGSSSAAPHGKGAPVIFHVARPNAPKPSRVEPEKVASSAVPAAPVSAEKVQSAVVAAATATAPSKIPPKRVVPSVAPRQKVSASEVPSKAVMPNAVTRNEVPAAAPVTIPAPPVVAAAPAVEPAAPEAEVASASKKSEQPAKSRSMTLILVAAAAVIVVAAVYFFVGRHHAPPAATTASPAPTVSAPAASAAPVSSSPSPAPAVAAPVVAPAVPAPAATTPEPAPPVAVPPPDTTPAKIARDNPLPAEPGRNLGTLLVVAGQDGASVSLNGKPEPQLTRSGQLRVANLDVKDYVVQVSKGGFQDPAPQKIRIRKGELVQLVFSLQPQPRPAAPGLASLTIQGGDPGTTVLVDQAAVGTVQSDGTLSVSNVNPGDHTIELRKERFKPRQFKKHFVAGEAISLAAADAAMEAAPAELKITFTPADAKVAIVKGDVLKMVSSGVPLNVEAGNYTLTARTADRFTRTSTLEVVGGQSKAFDLSLAPNGMSRWDDPGGWKPEKDSFVRKGGEFVLYGVAPASGTFSFSAMLTKGHLLQWVVNYTDAKNYILIQVDDNYFYRAVFRNGQKADEIRVTDKSEDKGPRTVRIRVSATEIVHQIQHGKSWSVVDRWTQPGANLSQGKFGFYIPGSDQIAVSGFAHYADLNIR